MSCPAQQLPRRPDRLAVVVELQGDADDVVALLREQGGDDGGIDATRHGDDDRVADGSADVRWRGGRYLRDAMGTCWLTAN